MSTLPKELSPKNAHEPLVRSRQRFGILPTLRFWNRRENWRPVRYPMAGLALGTILAVQVIDLPPIVGGIAVGATMYLGVGVMERILRRALERRRARYENLERRLHEEDRSPA